MIPYEPHIRREQVESILGTWEIHEKIFNSNNMIPNNVLAFPLNIKRKYKIATIIPSLSRSKWYSIVAVVITIAVIISIAIVIVIAKTTTTSSSQTFHFLYCQQILSLFSSTKKRKIYNCHYCLIAVTKLTMINHSHSRCRHHCCCLCHQTHYHHRRSKIK